MEFLLIPMVLSSSVILKRIASASFARPSEFTIYGGNCNIFRISLYRRRKEKRHTSHPMKTISALAIVLSFVALPLFAAENPFTPPNFPLPKFPDKTFNVKDFGATGSGETNDTPAINAAIEKCNSSGGGTVYFPDGKYSSASIHIKSNVRLLLSSNAVI